jgi:Reverse transcriptase (RNA-dependent DNA polymerase).
LNSDVFPNEWKTAKAKPLYKKGDRNDVQNYRPILVLYIFSKLLERLMFNRLIHILSDNRIFKEAQNGFRKGKCIKNRNSIIYRKNTRGSG